VHKATDLTFANPITRRCHSSKQQTNYVRILSFQNLHFNEWEKVTVVTYCYPVSWNDTKARR